MLSKHFILSLLSFLYFPNLFSCDENFFVPIPKGNGKYNENYNHSNTDNLYFIFEHFRHGARSPCTRPLFNGKDLLGSPWPGVGELTKFGSEQHFLLGKKNRERYKEFIKEKFDNNEIVLYSTNYHRTIMSAQSHLLGFFNQNYYRNFSNIEFNPKKIINYNFSKIIPPIHLLEKEKKSNGSIEYKPTFHTYFHCPNMQKNYRLNIKNKNQKIYEILKNFNKEYYEIIKTEYNITNTTKFRGLYEFCDAVLCNYFEESNINSLSKFKKHGKNLKNLVNTCTAFLNERFFGLMQNGLAKEHGIVTMSETMKKMVDWMKNRTMVEKNYTNNDSPKYVLYSGHDDTLTSMQRFLKNAFNIDFEIVPFASNQIFEIRKYGNEFYVELYYNDRLKLNISFNLFEKRINEIAMSKDEIISKCYGFDSKNNSFRFNKKSVIFGFMILIFFGAFIFMREENSENIEEVETMTKVVQII